MPCTWCVCVCVCNFSFATINANLLERKSSVFSVCWLTRHRWHTLDDWRSSDPRSDSTRSSWRSNTGTPYCQDQLHPSPLSLYQNSNFTPIAQGLMRANKEQYLRCAGYAVSGGALFCSFINLYRAILQHFFKPGLKPASRELYFYGLHTDTVIIVERGAAKVPRKFDFKNWNCFFVKVKKRLQNL